MMVRIPRWRYFLIILIGLFGVLNSLPNIISSDWLPQRELALGLDLQGGSHLLLEVDISSIWRERLDNVKDALRASLKREKIDNQRLNFRNLRLHNTYLSWSLPSFDTNQLVQLKQKIREVDADLSIEINSDNNTLNIAFSDAAKREISQYIVSQSIEIVRRRIDETGTKEPVIQRQGSNQIVVELPGVDDPERIKSLLGQTAKMTFHLVDQQARLNNGRIKPGYKALPPYLPNGGENQIIVNKRIMVNGENLLHAQVQFQDNLPVVALRFDSLGKRRFATATKKYTGKRFAIVLDEKVVSAPVIREPILSGQGVISGGFSTVEAKDLALLLRAGALPAPLNILEERTIGPGLGADSVNAGKQASIAAIALVALFIIAYYRLFGVFAVLALAFNLILLVALLTYLEATLTLPGIAGIVLTIGMAVDTNVLIFQRIKEEYERGLTLIAALETGFNAAKIAIIDANITTLLSGVVLYSFGTGPIRGFAVTLIFGIITSMFAGLFVTRMLVMLWYKWRQPNNLPIAKVTS